MTFKAWQVMRVTILVDSQVQAGNAPNGVEALFQIWAFILEHRPADEYASAVGSHGEQVRMRNGASQLPADLIEQIKIVRSMSHDWLNRTKPTQFSNGFCNAGHENV